MTQSAIIMWTNDVYHPRAYTYREGFRHCLLFIHTKDGWYGREFRPGQGEIIYPRVAEADDDLLAKLGGNHEPAAVDLDPDLAKRRANVLPAEIKTNYQWRWAWYRKRSVFHVMHHLGIKPRAVRKPYDLFKFLSPVEESPKRTRKVAIVVSPFVPAK